MRVGKLALIVPVMTSTEGRCVAMMRWMPAARAICARRWTAPSMSLPATIIRSAISSMMTTMKGIGSSSSSSVSKIGSPVSWSKPVCTVRVSRSFFFAALGDALVEAVDVAHAELRHLPVAVLHLAHRPFQRHHRLARVGDDRRQQMRDAVIDRQLQHLRVDHDQPALVGRQPVEQRQDHRVDRDRLARAGGAGDQQMRHAGEVGDHRLAADRLAERERQLGLGVLVVGRGRAARAGRPSRGWRWAARCRWRSCRGSPRRARRSRSWSGRCRRPGR